MCQKCVDAVIEIFPDADDDYRNYLLWNYTCFPFGEPEQVREMLEHVREVGTARVDREFDEQYEAALNKEE